VNRAGPALVAVLAVLALAVGAATLDSTPAGSAGSADAEAGPSGPGDGSAFDLGRPNVSATTGGGELPSLLRTLLSLLVATLFVVALAASYRRYREHGLRGPAAVALGGLAVAAVLAALLTSTDLSGFFDVGGIGGVLGEREPSLPGGGGGDPEAAPESVGNAPAALLALFALATLVVVAVVVRSADPKEERGPEREPASADPDEPADADAAAGRAAGRAADRIAGDAEIENEVYRAWREMTTHLDVADPRSSTPAELAAAAIDAGMRREDVAALTDLFERTRYGGRAATPAREERAVAALRRIEAAHVGDVGRETEDEDRGSEANGNGTRSDRANGRKAGETDRRGIEDGADEP
jgi:hypothetical protein